MIDRVKHFEKAQSIEFEQHVDDLVAGLGRIDDIEIRGAVPSDASSRRLIRKIALKYRGTAVTVQPLGGGLTGAPVWFCSVFERGGSAAARVVAKQASSATAESGSFVNILPAGIVAAPMGRVGGLCNGTWAALTKVAGDTPTPLLDLAAQDRRIAAVCLESIARSLDPLTEDNPSSLTIEEIAAPLIDWAKLTELLNEFSLKPPPKSRLAGTVVSEQHGDFHPANVLVADGRPLIIDLDSQVKGSRVLDPLCMLMGTFFHPDSLIADHELSVDRLVLEAMEKPEALAEVSDEWLSVCCAWVQTRVTSARELWMLVLAFSVRQLKYDDVKSDNIKLERALLYAKSALERLDD